MRGFLEVLNGHLEGLRAEVQGDAFSVGADAACSLDLSATGEPGVIRCRALPDRVVVDSIDSARALLNEQTMGTGDMVENGDIISLGRIRVYVGLGDDRVRRDLLKRAALRTGR